MIDSLRGLAAMGVVIFHLHGNLRNSISGWFPDFLTFVCEHGFLGVPVFFVLSGFVISHSTDNANVTAKYICMFALRRSIRLDPPYWIAIITAIVLTVVKNNLFPQYYIQPPSIGTVVAHIFYVQDILLLSPISSIFWTLCLEIQLYFFFISSRWIFQQFRNNNAQKEWRVDAYFLIVIGILSSLVKLNYLSIDVPGFFLPYWHHFLLGVLANWAIKRKISHVMYLMVIVFFIVLLIFRAEINTLFAVSTSLLIWIIGCNNTFDRFLSGKYLQYLGKISYSLYLLHSEIGWKYLSIAKQFTGAIVTPFVGTVLFLSGIAVSIISAHFLYYLVERPALNLSKKFKLN